MGVIRDLIATRGAQLIARYAAMGLIALGTKLAVNADAAQTAASANEIAAFVVAGILALIDHYSHAAQATDAK